MHAESLIDSIGMSPPSCIHFSSFSTSNRQVTSMKLLKIAITSLTFAFSSTFVVPTVAEDSVWVAVGYGGRRMISTDGKTWKITAEWAQPGKDDSNNLMGLIHAQNKFIAVGGGGGGKTGGGHVLISTDGEAWREVWKAPGRINPIVYGDGRFVVGGPRKQMYWSTDGEDWTPGARLEDRRCSHFRQGAYGNGVFVITGNNGGNSPAWICTTKDGRTVSDFTFDIPNIRGLTFADGKFVIVGEGVRIVSTDGIDWQQTGLQESERLTWVIHTGSEFLCGGGKNLYSSTDGVHWVEDPRRFRGTPKWTDGTRFISTSWPGKMFYSSDSGKTWQAANKLTANGINRVVEGKQE